jgi:hypothetical protein
VLLNRNNFFLVAHLDSDFSPIKLLRADYHRSGTVAVASGIMMVLGTLCLFIANVIMRLIYLKEAASYLPLIPWLIIVRFNALG